METHENSAKTPAPSENGNSIKQSGTSARDAEEEKISSAMPGQEEGPVNDEVKARSEEHAVENAGTAGTDGYLPDKGEPEVPATRENGLSQILEVSRGFMKNLQTLAGKGLPGRRGAPGNTESVADRGKIPVSRRLRDWDTREFVLSTLKRLVDNEHFEELEEEDSRIKFTRETMQIRNKILAEKDKRQHRKPKVEKLLPMVGRAGKATDEEKLLNTREKQRMEESRQSREQRLSAKAGKALGDALQKVTVIKDPYSVTKIAEEIPEEISEQDNEVFEQRSEVTEQESEVKEQTRQKRGFFNFPKKL